MTEKEGDKVGSFPLWDPDLSSSFIPIGSPYSAVLLQANQQILQKSETGLQHAKCKPEESRKSWICNC